ncbi:unnamed protein product [Leptidea sinapis]|uniref:Nanos-type domain-containing protein n=1 Tax=Leptidea sinapis TaxID=189913 RepID=A0A5E4R538_9NEOP|nr:unnamed protein product [Leptidea sinapis]
MLQTQTYTNDYSTGSSDSFLPSIKKSSWSAWQQDDFSLRRRSTSFVEGAGGSSCLDAVMLEFQLNGLDSPYVPEADPIKHSAFPGMGPPPNYLRQKSWPAPDSTPGLALPISDAITRVAAELLLQPNPEEGTASLYMGNTKPTERYADVSGLGAPSNYLRQSSWPVPDRSPAASYRSPGSADLLLQATAGEDIPGMGTPGTYMPQTPWPVRTPDSAEVRTAELLLQATSGYAPAPREQSLQSEQQQLLLNSFPPGSVLHELLRIITQAQASNYKPRRKQEECRFCKNNGERASYYRSHSLRVAGLVECPVLRALTCQKCGASGDHAHTIKYCPLTSADERRNSVALMQSVRLGSSARRLYPRATSMIAPEHVVYGEPTSRPSGGEPALKTAPLDPLWSELEKKLMI